MIRNLGRINPRYESFFTGYKRHTAFAITEYPLKNSALLDSGTTPHIFNQISRFNNFHAAIPRDYVMAGDHPVPILGYGNVDIKVEDPKGYLLLTLYDIAYCENFAINLVSLRQLQKHGYWRDTWLSENCFRTKNGRNLCYVHDHCEQFLLEHIPRETSAQSFLTRRNKFNFWTGRRPSNEFANGGIFDWVIRSRRLLNI